MTDVPVTKFAVYALRRHETLRGETGPETDGREGLITLELLIAMYLSSRDGKRVALPLAFLIK